MKLFPHEVIESLHVTRSSTDQIMRTLGPNKAREVWEDTYKISFDRMRPWIDATEQGLRQATVYDFGTLSPHESHTEFAALLFEHGKWNNYATTCVVQDCGPVETNRVLSLIGTLQGVLVYTAFAVSKRKLIVPFGYLVNPRISIHHPKSGKPLPKNIRFTHGATAKMSGPMMSCDDAHIFINSDQASTEDIEDLLFENFLTAMSLLAMLGCREVEQVTVPAPVKLNKKRLSNHKPIIAERREIKINVSTPSLHVNYENDDSQLGKGTPKRPHWRRPHPHRLPKSGIIKLYPPTWVNWDEDSGLPRPPIKNYRIR